MPGGARSFPSQRNAALCPDPWVETADGSEGTRARLWHKTLPCFSNEVPRLSGQRWLPAVNATPLLIQLQSVPTAVPEQWGTRFLQPYFWGRSYTKHSKNQTRRLQPHPCPWSRGGQQQLPAWLTPSSSGSLGSPWIRPLSAWSLPPVLQNAPKQL